MWAQCYIGGANRGRQQPRQRADQQSHPRAGSPTPRLEPGWRGHRHPFGRCLTVRCWPSRPADQRSACARRRLRLARPAERGNSGAAGAHPSSVVDQAFRTIGYNSPEHQRPARRPTGTSKSGVCRKVVAAAGRHPHPPPRWSLQAQVRARVVQGRHRPFTETGPAAKIGGGGIVDQTGAGSHAGCRRLHRGRGRCTHRLPGTWWYVRPRYISTTPVADGSPRALSTTEMIVRGASRSAAVILRS